VVVHLLLKFQPPVTIARMARSVTAAVAASGERFRPVRSSSQAAPPSRRDSHDLIFTLCLIKVRQTGAADGYPRD
jgi:hypothetical protein